MLAAQQNNNAGGSRVGDGARMAILSNRLEAIARRMQNTLFRTGRSGVLNTAHDSVDASGVPNTASSASAARYHPHRLRLLGTCCPPTRLRCCQPTLFINRGGHMGQLQYG